MSTIFLFRGKAATGKTTITNLLSKELNVAVLRKDDIYDKLAMYNLEHSVLNSASYDVLAKILQTNIDGNCNIIIDIALPHNPALNQFLSKVDLTEVQVFQFLCICSNNEEWEKRIKQRLINPTPNQFFKNVEEAVAHYQKMNINPFENELVLDSSDNISDTMEKIYKMTKAERMN